MNDVGVAETASEAVPFPAPFTALILTLYAVEFAKPVIVKGEVVEAGLGVVHVEPLSVEYS